MSKQTYPSTVAHFREQQTQQEEAAFLGLHGLAVVARHDVIEAQMHRQAQRLVHLLANGQHEEVERQMNRPNWGLGERDAHDGTP